MEGGDSEEDTPVPVVDHQVELPPEVKEPSTKKGGRRKLAMVEEEEEMKEASVTPEDEVVEEAEL